MNTFEAIKQRITDALIDIGVQTFEYLPARITPPMAFLVAGSPWIEDGATFGGFTVRYQVTLVVGQASNEVATANLDALTARAIVALDNAGLPLERADEPNMLAVNNANYMAVNLSLTFASEIDSAE